MKRSLLTIALAVATMPLTFAAKPPQANPPASNSAATPAKTTATTKTKKHTPKVRKASKKHAAETGAAAATPVKK